MMFDNVKIYSDTTNGYSLHKGSDFRGLWLESDDVGVCYFLKTQRA